MLSEVMPEFVPGVGCGGPCQRSNTRPYRSSFTKRKETAGIVDSSAPVCSESILSCELPLFSEVVPELVPGVVRRGPTKVPDLRPCLSTNPHITFPPGTITFWDVDCVSSLSLVFWVVDVIDNVLRGGRSVPFFLSIPCIILRIPEFRSSESMFARVSGSSSGRSPFLIVCPICLNVDLSK